MSTRKVRVDTGITRRDGDKGTRFYANVSDRYGNRREQSFATLKAARTWRADMQAEVARSGAVPERTPQLAPYWNDVRQRMERGILRTAKGSPFRAGTIETHDQKMRRHVLPEFGASRLEQITRPKIQQFVDELVRDRYAGGTIQGIIHALSACFRAAIRDGYDIDNRTLGVQTPSAGKRGDEHAIEPHVAAALIARLARKDDQRLWALMFYGGLRIGEALAIQPEDIDLKNGILTVSKSIDDDRNVGPTKNGKARRVPILEPLAAHLRFAGPNIVPTTTRNSTRSRAITAWGDDYVIPHSARHTFASMMIAAGVSYKELSEVLGHSSIAITLDVYGHLLPSNYENMRIAGNAYFASASDAANEA